MSQNVTYVKIDWILNQGKSTATQLCPLCFSKDYIDLGKETKPYPVNINKEIYEELIYVYHTLHECTSCKQKFVINNVI